MRPRIVDSLNKIFDTEIWGYIVPSPVLMYVLAMLAVTVVFVQRCHRSGLSRYHALGFSLWAIIGGMIGARAFFLLLHLKATVTHPSVIFDVSGGTISWGAYLGGIIGLTLYLKFHREPLLPYVDVLSSCQGLGPFIGRWSCFLNGCCFGKLSELPWAVSYPHGSIPYLTQVHAGLIEDGVNFSLPVHPVQLYQSFNGLVLFGLMTWFWRKWNQRTGITFFSFWIIYCCTRFILDYFCGDVTYRLWGLLSITQIMAMSIAFLSSIGLYYSLKRVPT